MIHTSGQQLLTRPQLHKIPVPEREGTKYWQGVNHGVLADTLVNHVKKSGFGVDNETWYCNPNQTALWGSIDLDIRGTDFELDLGQDAKYSIGVRHDNAGRYAVSFAVGARVTVCSNGLFSGDFVLKHRHYGSLDIEDAIANGMETWYERSDEVEKFARLMQGVELDDRDAAFLISRASMESTEYGCFPWDKAQRVMAAWNTPPHEEFRPRTLWSCYNAFTEVAKDISPPRQVRMLKGLRTMVTEYAATGTLAK